jgi:hypothetical protein
MKCKMGTGEIFGADFKRVIMRRGLDQFMPTAFESADSRGKVLRQLTVLADSTILH